MFPCRDGLKCDADAACMLWHLPAEGLQAEFPSMYPLETAGEWGFLGKEEAVGVRSCEKGLISTNAKVNPGLAVAGGQMDGVTSITISQVEVVSRAPLRPREFRGKPFQDCIKFIVVSLGYNVTFEGETKDGQQQGSKCFEDEQAQGKQG